MSESDQTLLLVDDTPTNLEVLYQTLEATGCRLLIATNGADAVDVARKAQPDLILLDVMMPDMDGHEVCRALKADPTTERSAVIFLSALNETEDKLKGFELGAVDYITKPFQGEEVVARVQTHLKLRRLERDLSERNQELEQVNQRMREDLEAAARVQRGLLPELAPTYGRFQFAFQYLPCDELAGDALNVFRVNDNLLAAYLLDVSGHGVPAALLSVGVTRNLLRDWRENDLYRNGEAGRPARPCKIAERLNRQYPMTHNGNHFFTLLFTYLDISSGCCEMVCAGHPGPVLLRPGTDPAILEVKGGVPIGIMESTAYQDSQVQLQKGDRLYLLSDGLYEQRNAEGLAVGLERVLEVFAGAASDTLAASVQAAVSEVDAWRGERPFDDDISILALEVGPP